MKVFSVIVSLIILVLLGLLYTFSTEKIEKQEVAEVTEMGFSDRDLATNTNKKSIDLDLVLSGGPRKDGIPAINEPKFTSVEGADIADDVRGLLVEIDGIQKFYPYSILVWHEIVNDTIGNVSIAATFCPLCDSGIVYNRNVGGEILQFGVSGLLYESNLLMYDTQTESLWSQALGEGVVGEYTGTELEILPLQLLTFEEVKEKYAGASVLSADTGHYRNYKRNPYAGYESNELLVFGVSHTDERFHPKELFYVIPFNDNSVAFPYKQFEEGERSFDVSGETITITRDGGEIYVYNKGELLPGYFELWFSWIVHHQDDGIVLEI